MAQGETPDEVRSALAHSAEAAAGLGGLYGQVLGRAPDAAGLAGWEDKLAQGETLTEVRSDIAHSAESAGYVTAFYGDTLGVAPSATDLANCEGALANGQSRADQQAFLRPNFAHSQTAQNAISGLFQDVLGRPATQQDVDYWTGQLAQGYSLAQIRSVFSKCPSEITY